MPVLQCLLGEDAEGFRMPVDNAPGANERQVAVFWGVFEYRTMKSQQRNGEVWKTLRLAYKSL